MSQLHRIRRTIHALRRHPRASRGSIVAFQNACLRDLVRHAYDNVPYYRMLFDRHQIDPRAIQGVGDLAKIPISSKGDLREQPRAVIARGVDPARLRTSVTSGSSGEPFEIRRTLLEHNLLHLFQWRARRLLGQQPGDRIARILQPHSVRRQDSRLVGMMVEVLGIERNLHLSLAEAPQILFERLRAFRPDIVTGFPAVLTRLAAEAEATLLDGISPRLVLTDSEVLTPAMRACIRSGWRTPVYELYASHETRLIGWECPARGGLHSCDDAVILEVLRDGRAVRPGERGEVVVTALHSYAMPFIRYRLGDIVTRGKESCACGLPFATIRTIQGRMLDLFCLPSGRYVHPYEILAGIANDRIEWISQHQLVQERIDRIVLLFVPVGDVRPARIAEFERFATGVVGPGVEICVQPVSEIRPGEGDKFRICRSLVHSCRSRLETSRSVGGR
jgi:phenylacetate-CoA ligase